MIPKPEQQDRDSAIEYLREISKQVIQARADINEAWQLSDEEELYKIVSGELDKVSDSLVMLLDAWKDVQNQNFSDADTKASTANVMAEKSALHVWDELARYIYEQAELEISKKSRFTQANMGNSIRFRNEGEELRQKAAIGFEKDEYSAIATYKEAVKTLNNAIKEAELARLSVRGQTLQAWVKIALAFIIALAAIIVIPLRGCHPKSNQIPSRTTVPAETNEPNFSK